ncbi:MAG: diacylglycerol kinase [Pseudomonadota bacterium]|nr:MAG: diacylglycerol kinase [Pseudomonadota bacterium]
MKPGATGLTRILHAFGYSMRGIRASYVNEAAFRQEILLCAVLTPLGVWLGNNAVEWALLFGSLFIVLITELLNSAVEAAIDRIGSEVHELSGRAKDIGSAAVLFSLVNLAVIWGLIAWERFAAAAA